MNISTLNRLRKIAEDPAKQAYEYNTRVKAHQLRQRNQLPWLGEQQKGLPPIHPAFPALNADSTDAVRRSIEYQRRKSMGNVPVITNAKPGYYTPLQGYNRGNTVYRDSKGRETVVNRPLSNRLDSAWGIITNGASGLVSAIPNDVMDLWSTYKAMTDPRSYYDFNPFNDVTAGWDRNYNLVKEFMSPTIYRARDPRSRAIGDSAYATTNMFGQLVSNPAQLIKLPIKGLKYVPRAVKFMDGLIDAGQLGGVIQGIYEAVNGPKEANNGAGTQPVEESPTTYNAYDEANTEANTAAKPGVDVNKILSRQINNSTNSTNEDSSEEYDPNDWKEY